MATALKLRRGTTSQHSTFTGAEGELTVDTTKDTAVVHDGTTAGGFPLVTENTAQTVSGAKTFSGANTFTANQVISVTDNTNAALRVTQLGTGNALVVEDSTNPDSTPFVINNSGNVGIGTTNPQVALDVLRTGDVAQITAANGTIGQRVGYCAFGNAFSGSATNHPYVLLVNDTERIRIDTSGNVGIGTSNPTGRLHVRTAAGTTAQINLYSGNNTTTSKFNIGQIGAIDWDVGITATTGHFLIGGLGGTVAEAYRINRNGTAVDLHAWSTSGSERMRITSDGLLQFNNGYGSVATAYGCRAWVNFDGSGTVAIRASGNVSSITDGGTGKYTVNFTNAMPDSDYAALASAGTGATGGEGVTGLPATTPSASSIRVETTTDAGTLTDRPYISVAIFR